MVALVAVADPLQAAAGVDQITVSEVAHAAARLHDGLVSTTAAAARYVGCPSWSAVEASGVPD